MSENEASSTRKCLVCAVPVFAVHFGMDCCRACTSSFKRAKISGKKLKCRTGEGKCAIVKDVKFMCRRCRFDRCIAVGMVWDGPLRLNKRRMDFNENSPSSSEAASPSTSRSPCEPTILERIGIEYNLSVEKRRIQEEEILCACEDRKLVPHPTQKIYLANFRTSVKTYNVCLAETMVFLQRSFPTLADLSEQERDVIFESYIAKFSIIESLYRTRKVWGEVKRYCMVSELVCVDLESTDSWLVNEEGFVKRTSMLESIRSYSNSQFALVLPMFNKAQITTMEFHALLALVLCDVDTSTDISDHGLSTVHEIQQEIFEDLRRYYKEELGLNDFATRLGNLMTLNYTIRECNALFQRLFRMHTAVFDLHRSEETIKELFM